MKADLQELRNKCPLPELMARLGLGRFAKSSCPSPFRTDQHASWGIFQNKNRWMYKDFATGECGDEISLLAQVHKLDPKKEFRKLLAYYTELAHSTTCLAPSFQLPISEPALREKPDTSFLKPGTEDQISQLSALRRISVEGLRYAGHRGSLKFGYWCGHSVYAVVDGSGHAAEVRRLDGQLFDGFGPSAHKSHSLKHSRKNWPLGILEAEGPGIALVEGMPDLLCMHQFVVEEGLEGKVSPVAMMTSACEIAPDALPCFAGRRVRIFPHQDLAGINGAERWQKQLVSVEARIDFFNFKACEVAATIKDLCDFNQHRGAGFQPILTTLVL